MFRVARRGIFHTTPSRWFLIEFHSMRPPGALTAGASLPRHPGTAGHRELALEENLNLLSAPELATDCGIRDAAVTSVSLAGRPTNLLLSARK